jgi:hypothetical protein
MFRATKGLTVSSLSHITGWQNNSDRTDVLNSSNIIYNLFDPFVEHNIWYAIVFQMDGKVLE